MTDNDNLYECFHNFSNAMNYKGMFIKIQFLGSQGLEFLIHPIWDVTKNCVFNQYCKKILLSGKFGRQ